LRLRFENNIVLEMKTQDVKHCITTSKKESMSKNFGAGMLSELMPQSISDYTNHWRGEPLRHAQTFLLARRLYSREEMCGSQYP